MGKLVVSLSILCFWSMLASGNPSVRIKQGLLSGSYMKTTRGRTFAAFRGIPYAKPPLGALRFKAPLPASPWNGTYDASQDAPKCPQVSSVTGTLTYEGNEDCLSLTVYTHSVQIKGKIWIKRLPVFVYMHGGSLTTGSVQSTEYPPERLMNQPIVIVLPQYRLSALGFMSTGDTVSPGNYGLLDQVLALQWVQENIDRFGGDRNRVTLAGVSAGGISVGYHMVSPLSKGLFRAAILQSGPVLANVAVQTDPLPVARRLGSRLSCNSNNTVILVECLRNASARQLAEASVAEPGIAVPVVENPEYGKFVFETPTKLFTEGRFAHVPTMIGTVKDEGAAVVINGGLLQLIEAVPAITDAMLDSLFNSIVPALISVVTAYDTNLLNISYAAKDEYGKIYDFYDKKQLTQFLIDILGDALFVSPAAKLASLLAAHNVTTYLYSFEYAGNLSTLSFFGEKAVNHGDDARYLLLPNQTEIDSRYSDKFGTMFSNFVHFLNPTPRNRPVKWSPTPDVKKLWYLKFGNDSIGTEEGYFTERAEFWNDEVPRLAGNTTGQLFSTLQFLD